MKFKLICGPMATISNPAFRILLNHFNGCDEYFTEMINAGTLITNGPFEKFYLNPQPEPDKIVWQLTGKSTELIKKATETIVQLPGIGIDLNMGCSAPDIYRFGAGIAWMLKPLSETVELVHTVRKIIDNYNNENNEHKRFSVKYRLGDDDFTDKKFFDFSDMLVQEGVDLLTLHPRTKKEKLIKTPRYEYCNELSNRYRNSDVKVYLNGNVKDIISFQNAIEKCPDCDGVMISRAAVSKPWIFSQIKNYIDNKEINNRTIDLCLLALEYIDNIEKYQPPEFWKTRLQRFFTYYSENFLFSHYAQTQFLNAKDNDDLRLRIKIFFEKCPEEQYKDVYKL